MTAPTIMPIYGGFHIKTLDSGECIDVLQMTFNWRIVLSNPDHTWINAAFCYFGHGFDERGIPRTMNSALLAAMLAAMAWDGTGEPPGYDKRAL